MAQPKDQDTVLSDLVNMADKTGMSFSVTLFVGGLIISGALVGYRVFFERFARELEQGYARVIGDDDAAEMVKPFRDVADEPFADEEGEGEDTYILPLMIHIENAFIFTPDQQETFAAPSGILWRGRLSAVDGFFLGTVHGAGKVLPENNQGLDA